MMTTADAAVALLAFLGITTLKPFQKETAFNRSMLPSPEQFWAAQGVIFHSRKGWVISKCIFHEDSHPSMSVNTESGGFFCHACNAKGGDVLDAHRLITGCDFMTAAKELGAWEK